MKHMCERTNSVIYDLWKYSMDLKDTPLTLRGHSRGSEASCFYIPELKTFLDAGCKSYFNPDYIFITHCHSDHSFELPMILTGLNREGKAPPQIYAPNESQKLFQDFLQITYKLRKGTDKAFGHFCIIGAFPSMDVDLNKNGYFVRIYDLHHNVPTRGYGVCQKRSRLNPKYHGFSGKDLKGLKDNGVDINVYIIDKMVAYVLDTTIKCFCTNPELLEYRYVIVECTFFMNETCDVTKNHIHWCELKQIVLNNPKVQFILVHFSMRYTWDEINNFFDEEKKIIPNIIVWNN